MLDDVSAELRELSVLTNELVTLAMEDSDDEVPVELDLADLATRAAARAQRRRGCAVHVDAETARVMGRPRLLLRALDNLLDNAAKFDTTRPPDRGDRPPGTVIVRDHGPGVAPEDQPRVFDRFYRALPARSQPGSGLGLAIVRAAVAAHGGQVTVTNHPAGGALFAITLPVAGTRDDPDDRLDPAPVPGNPQEPLGNVLRRRSPPLTSPRQPLGGSST